VTRQITPADLRMHVRSGRNATQPRSGNSNLGCGNLKTRGRQWVATCFYRVSMRSSRGRSIPAMGSFGRAGSERPATGQARLQLQLQGVAAVLHA
jgi:hypothetical protein